jgi:hypothetical protein
VLMLTKVELRRSGLALFGRMRGVRGVGRQ